MTEICPNAGAAKTEAARIPPRYHFTFMLLLLCSVPGVGADACASRDVIFGLALWERNSGNSTQTFPLSRRERQIHVRDID